MGPVTQISTKIVWWYDALITQRQKAHLYKAISRRFSIELTNPNNVGPKAGIGFPAFGSLEEPFKNIIYLREHELHGIADNRKELIPESTNVPVQVPLQRNVAVNESAVTQSSEANKLTNIPEEVISTNVFRLR